MKEDAANTDRPAMATAPGPHRAPKADSNKWLLTALILLLLLGGAGAYWWRDKEAKAQAKKQQAEITALQQKISELEAKDTTGSTDDDECTVKQPNADTIENIKASITSGNTAALEGYMAPTVRVILAASEGVGDRTPAQAVGDIDYVEAGTDPWDFELPEATLNAWGSGSYAQYFPDTAVVGKSANDYVISFTFDCDGKISGVFMAVNDDLL